MNRLSGTGVAAVEQRGWHESPPIRVRSDESELLRIAVDELRLALEFRELLQYLAALAHRRDRTHSNAFETRVAYSNLAESRLQRFYDIRSALCGDDRLADRRALLPGLRGHLAHHFADEQVELRRTGAGVRTQYR